ARVPDYPSAQGAYQQTEDAMRAVLAKAPAKLTHVADATPTEVQTPESYLGTARLARYVGSRIHPNVPARYTFASALPPNDLTYAGTWTVGAHQIVAGRGAKLRIHFRARYVYIVLGGKGTVRAL